MDLTVKEVKAQMQTQAQSPECSSTDDLAKIGGYSLMLFLIGLALLGGWLIYQRDLHVARLLETEGLVVQARLAGRESSSKGTHASYYVSYAFTAVAGDHEYEVQRKDRVPQEVYFDAENADAIQVIYARSNPRIAKIHALYTPGRVDSALLNLVSLFFAGLFLANGIPHFVSGISGRKFHSPFAQPFVKGLSSPLSNVVWGLINLTLSLTLLTWSKGLILGMNPGFVAFACGFGLAAPHRPTRCYSGNGASV